MTFEVTSRVRVTKDDEGVVRKINHPREPYHPETAESRTSDIGANGGQTENDSLRQLADEYVREVMPIYGLDESVADDLEGAVGVTPTAEASKLRYLGIDKVANQAVISYTQTELRIPVWQSGMSVKLLRDPGRVIGSKSSLRKDIDVQSPPSDSPYLPNLINSQTLAQVLDLGDNQTPTMNSTGLLIYQLDPDFRGNGVGPRGENDETQMHVAGPTLELPELPPTLVAKQYYVTTEALFTLKLPEGDMNWRALIEPQSGAVLRLDAFVGCFDGYVFLVDPFTKTGNPDIRPDSATEVLDQLRDRVPLEGLIPSSPQELRGRYVHVRDIGPPNTLPPTEPTGSHFLYSVPTDDCSAVNAYYHCDRLFRMLEEMGIDVEEYFDGTNFPIPVDHRVMFLDRERKLTANIVNAQAPGDIEGDGSSGFRFALVQKDTNVGIAINWRVILHEFGHTILWDHVHWPGFNFAHSPGDSLAAILVDPESKVPDRYLTFPWSGLQRRHDRPVDSGWGWGGFFDTRRGDPAGYNQEQILSSTLFRFYRAIGGDHSDTAVRTEASRYAAYVIFRAVGLLSAATPPRDAKAFADEMMDAEEVIDQFEGRPGGTTRKVIRWAYEHQGLYQAPRTRAVWGPGLPPNVDVYIDDGRNGEYEPRPNFVFSSKDIWNRSQADGQTKHQQPIADQSNFLYVRVKNRGTKEASNVTVKAFITSDGGERIWPTAWTALDPASVSAKPIPSKGETIVGPFSWTHSTVGPVSVLASVSAADDESAAENVSHPLPVVRLTHCDNNIAGRTLNVGSVTAPTEPSEIRAEVRPLLTIPDADPAGLISELEVSKSGTIKEVSVPISIMHTYIGDLLINLQSPAGSSIVLFEGRREDTSDNLITTLAPATVNALNDVIGENALGSWKLRVIDRAGLDEGTLAKWGLIIKTQ